MSKWIKKDDTVVAISGNDKGRHGKVLVRRDDKVVVEGLNMVTKHVKPSQSNPKGGRIQKEMPIHVSNLSFCDDEGNAFRVKVRFSGEGSKELISVKDGKETLLRVIRKGKKG